MNKNDEEVSVETEAEAPVRGSPEWQSYVMSLLLPSELVENNPTAAGLRRVCHEVLGNITSSRVEVIQYPDEKCNRAVVSYVISCTTPRLEEIFVEAVAECNDKNLGEPYSNHMVATAETRAEGRALKKLLLLNFSTAEELIGAKTVIEPASEVQLRSIKKQAGNLGINFDKFLAVFAGISESQFLGGRVLSRENAISLQSKLNDFKNDEKSIPGEIK